MNDGAERFYHKVFYSQRVSWTASTISAENVAQGHRELKAIPYSSSTQCNSSSRVSYALPLVYYNLEQQKQKQNKNLYLITRYFQPLPHTTLARPFECARRRKQMTLQLFFWQYQVKSVKVEYPPGNVKRWTHYVNYRVVVTTVTHASFLLSFTQRFAAVTLMEMFAHLFHLCDPSFVNSDILR